MPNKLFIAAGAIATLYSGWWYMATGALKQEVQWGIDELQHHMRVGNPNARLHVDGVSRAGFPFAALVAVEGVRFSVVYGDETFAVETPRVDVTRGGKDGSYTYSAHRNEGGAFYGKEGSVPETYRFAWDHPVHIQTRGDGGDHRISEVAFDLPESVTINATLGEKMQAINFTLNSMQRLALAQPQVLPHDISRAVMLMVGTLREALVYR